MNFAALFRAALLALPVLLVLAAAIHVAVFLRSSGAEPQGAVFLEPTSGGAVHQLPRAGATSLGDSAAGDPPRRSAA